MGKARRGYDDNGDGSRDGLLEAGGGNEEARDEYGETSPMLEDDIDVNAGTLIGLQRFGLWGLSWQVINTVSPP